MKNQMTFEICDTESEAIEFKNKLGKKCISITPWSSRDRGEHKYIVWYKV